MAKFFIHRPVFAIVISLIIMIAGGISIGTLPIAQYPQISPPTVEVEINYPGANSETVEQSIATNVEAEVNGAENMIYMSSKSSSDGRYVLTCTFKVGANLDLANVDINNRVNKATAKLPPEAISVRHFGEEEVAGHPAGDLGLLSGQHLRRDVPFQLHFDQSGGSHRAYSGRRFHHDRRPARLRHALLGPPGQTRQARADRQRSRQRDQRAEPRGSGRAGGTAAGEGGHAIPVHRQREGPAYRTLGIREHDRPHASGRLDSPNEGRLARGTFRQELHQLRPQRRHSRNRSDHLSAARRECDQDRREGPQAARGGQQELPAGPPVPHFAGHHRSSSRWPFTRCFSRCEMPSSWC